jgi:hypothetical protein
MQNLRNRIISSALCSVAAFSLAQKAHANLAANGDFSLNGGTGEVNYNTTITDWTSTGYNFAFTSATGADTTLGGAATQFNNNVWFWGPDNTSPVANGFTASPNGGSFVALDSYLAPNAGVTVGPLSQTINGLTVGKTYAVSFYWAGAQQAGYTGATTDQLLVSLGSQTLNSPVLNVASQGFSGWTQTTLDFTATSTSELLSFLAQGTPAVSDPPFALLDGVDVELVTTVPDSSSTVMLFGFTAAALAFAARRFSRQCRQ